MNDIRGKIMLVGIGPGSHDHMTQRAREAIASGAAREKLAQFAAFTQSFAQ